MGARRVGQAAPRDRGLASGCPAAAKARDAVLVSVIANVARAYIELRGYQAQLAVIRRNMETSRRESSRSRRPATARD